MLKKILKQVEKPGRYIGNEINMVKKNKNDVRVRFALCFPDVYEIGMSNLGIEILYFLLNQREDCYAERVYAPWPDMEMKLREENLPLFTLETQDPLQEFDFIAFTLQYELSYTNILNILDLAGLDVYANQRKEEDPLIICGGSGAYNPEVLAAFVDIFYIGEAEVLLNEIIDLYQEFKNENRSKEEFLISLLGMEGVYIPKFYRPRYEEDGTFKEMETLHPNAKTTIKKVICNSFDQAYFPEKKLVPLIETVQARVVLEIQRGCIRGCRFCQAGMVYRPLRERERKTLLKQSKTLLQSSGYDEVTLSSLASNDHSQIHDILDDLICETVDQHINISLPSLRLDSLNHSLIEKLTNVRKSSLTFAPEAGTQRLRDVINKNLDENEILKGIEFAFDNQYQKIKLYFMIGLPTENDDDIQGIADLSKKIAAMYRTKKLKRPLTISISNSLFVPKPHTPFQWEAQESKEGFIKKAHKIKNSLQGKEFKYNYHKVDQALVEGLLSRGDRKISEVLYEAYRLGAKFDAWNDQFQIDIWEKALLNCQIDGDFYTKRKRSFDEKLPWDHIFAGVNKEFLIDECLKAYAGITSENCKQSCKQCGANQFACGVCKEKRGTCID